MIPTFVRRALANRPLAHAEPGGQPRCSDPPGTSDGTCAIYRCSRLTETKSCAESGRSLADSGRAGTHAAYAHVSPAPSIIPYGGFAQVWSEALPSTGNPSASHRWIPIQHPHQRHKFSPSVLIPFRCHRLTVVSRRVADGAQRPLAQPSLSCPGLQSLLRPEAPVSVTPVRFVRRVIPPGHCHYGPSKSHSIVGLGSLKVVDPDVQSA